MCCNGAQLAAASIISQLVCLLCVCLCASLCVRIFTAGKTAPNSHWKAPSLALAHGWPSVCHRAQKCAEPSAVYTHVCCKLHVKRNTHDTHWISLRFVCVDVCVCVFLGGMHMHICPRGPPIARPRRAPGRERAKERAERSNECCRPGCVVECRPTGRGRERRHSFADPAATARPVLLIRPHVHVFVSVCVGVVTDFLSGVGVGVCVHINIDWYQLWRRMLQT